MVQGDKAKRKAIIPTSRDGGCVFLHKQSRRKTS
jgi:hypothetical protein